MFFLVSLNGPPMPTLSAYLMAYESSQRLELELLSHAYPAFPVRLSLCYHDSSICLVGRTGILARFDRDPPAVIRFPASVVIDVTISLEGWLHMADKMKESYDDIYELFDAFWDRYIYIEDVEDVVFP